MLKMALLIVTAAATFLAVTGCVATGASPGLSGSSFSPPSAFPSSVPSNLSCAEIRTALAKSNADIAQASEHSDAARGARTALGFMRNFMDIVDDNAPTEAISFIEQVPDIGLQHAEHQRFDAEQQRRQLLTLRSQKGCRA